MTDDYVTNGAWLSNPARDETIDEVADQFERREGAVAFWNEVSSRERYTERRAG
jgi:hypothetical protein